MTKYPIPLSPQRGKDKGERIMFRILYFGHSNLFRVSYFALRICYEIALPSFSAYSLDETLANRFSGIEGIERILCADEK